MAPEGLFVVSLAAKYGRAAWDEPTVRRFCRDLWHEERLRRWRLDPGALARQLLIDRRDAGYAEMCARVYAASAAARGKGAALRLGDKNPLYSLFVPALAELFPHARFLHVVRDYRDNVLSYRDVRFDTSSVPALAVRWRLYNEAVLDAGARLPGRLLRVRFEDLVSAPERCLRQICVFLDLAWDPSVMTAPRIPFYGLLAWHRRVADPIDPGRAGRWRTDLAPRDIEMADWICQPLGAVLGYAPHATAPPRLRLRDRIGAALGHSMTAGEREVMRVPLALRSPAVRAYRRWTGNRIE
jgi:hypothetical protein